MASNTVLCGLLALGLMALVLGAEPELDPERATEADIEQDQPAALSVAVDEPGPELQKLFAQNSVSDATGLHAVALDLLGGPGSNPPPSTRSRRAALDLLRPLVSHGHAPAHVTLARELLLGDGVPRDVNEAVALLRAAADDGDEDGQQMLGMLYALGLGVPQDSAFAMTHYYFAAEGGSMRAQLALAYRHLHGVDAPKSCAKSLMYYNPVAARVVEAVQKAGGRGLLIEKVRLTDGPARAGRRLLGDDEDIIQYYQYSAEKGSVDAQLTLGQLSFHGARGLPHDPAAALAYYARAAEAGEPAAHAHIGHLYAQGIGVEQSHEAALKHFRLGAARGHPGSLNGLGFMYMHGHGVEQSHTQAKKHFDSAADKGNAEAQFNLGAMYVSGMGVKKNYETAIRYFTLAAHQGHTLALYNLGQMHHHGLGAPVSCPAAVQFLKAVAERGDWGADLERGARAFSSEGDPARALLLYGPLAEAGFEVAQANVAHIADSSVRRGVEASELPFVHDARALALDMFARSAQQGNVEAQIKLGDYHFYGFGTKADAERAVAHYRTASEAQNAQAMFNLAYMHAHGLGLPRDFHLAKRHYDMAMESTSEAIIPVKIALFELYFMQLLEEMSQWPSVQRIQQSALWRELMDVAYADGEWQWDTIAIAVLVPLLTAVITMRRARRRPAVVL